MKRRLFTSTLLTGGFLAAGNFISLVNGKSALATPADSLSNTPRPHAPTPHAPPPNAQQESAIAPTLTVFRSPTCSCCEDWVTHVQSAGFTVEDHITENMDAIKIRYGIPEPLATCHTALITADNSHRYWVEGHVPAADIHRLLAEQPAVAGIATPGMPIGSPGMEQGSEVEPYQVIAFTTAGKFTVFANHG